MNATQIATALKQFSAAIKLNGFPHGPVIIPDTDEWRMIEQVDMPTALEKGLDDSSRLDSASVSISKINAIPKSWYDEKATGHFRIRPNEFLDAARMGIDAP